MPKRSVLAMAAKTAKSKPANTQSLAKLEALLNDQQAKQHEREDVAFLEQRDSEYRRSITRAFPRTFDNKQFFTPHLQRETQAAKDPVKREYVIVLSNGLVVRQAQKSRSGPVPHDFSPSRTARDRVRQLESQGWTVCGQNGDMIELERLYNPRDRARDATWKSAKRYTIGVITLTIAIYGGQYFMN